jgi:hypothetical protein
MTDFGSHDTSHFSDYSGYINLIANIRLKYYPNMIPELEIFQILNISMNTIVPARVIFR